MTMDAIDIVVSNCDGNVVGINEKEPEIVQSGEVVQGKVVQRNYVLNDTAAMKKKLKNEMNKKEPYDKGVDAKDGSNVVLFLKTSLFEYVKSQMMQDLLKMDEVRKIDNAVGIKK